MSEELARRFVDALDALEHRHEVEPLVALFADDADVGNVVSHRTFTGTDGAREFWQEYRSSFGTVRSTFRNVVVAAGRVVFEWETTGTSVAGAPFGYAGASVLEIAGGRIVRFRAYFDAAALARQLEVPVDDASADESAVPVGGP